MADLVETRWTETLRELVGALNSGDAVQARVCATEIETAYQAGALPAQTATVWAAHRAEVAAKLDALDASASAGDALESAMAERAEAEQLLTRLQMMLAHIPAACRHQVGVGTELFQQINALAQAGQLPADLAAIWQTHRQTLLDAGAAANDFADGWNAAYPIVRSELSGD